MRNSETFSKSFQFPSVQEIALTSATLGFGFLSPSRTSWVFSKWVSCRNTAASWHGYGEGFSCRYEE